MSTPPLDEVPQPARPVTPAGRAATLRALHHAPRCAHTHPARAPAAPPPPCPPGTPARPLPRALTRLRTLSRSPAAARHLRRTFLLLPLVLLAVWAAADRRTVSEGAARLAAADPGWLLAGAGFSCLCWVAAACSRQGALPERLPPGLLLASQFAAGAANHVLPAGLGAHAVTLRFLRRQGIPMARATASIALYSLVRPLAKLPLLLLVVAAVPDTLRPGDLLPGVPLSVPWTDGATGILAVALVVLVPVLVLFLVRGAASLRRTLSAFLRTALTDARTVHSRPARALALWGGALAFPLCQGSVVACVATALGLPVAWPHILFAFLAAGTAAAAVPAPGGIGPVDAALVFALTAYGAPLPSAVATVLGYRVLTVWLPLLPGALALSVLVRNKAL